MTLREDIKKFQEEKYKDIPKETMDIFMKATEKLVSTGIAERSLKKGDRIPMFSLSNIEGNEIFIKDLLDKGPVVISFFRGSWCPYCNLEFAALQKIYPEIKELGASLVSISPSVSSESKKLITKHSLSFDLLSDKQNKVAKEFGLVFVLDSTLRPLYEKFGIDIPKENGDESYELPIPATYVIDKKGNIVFSYVNADYTTRAEPSEILEVLKKFN